MSINLEELKENVKYEPETGVFYWVKSRYRKCVGQPIKTDKSSGYERISVLNKRYSVHRLAWFYMTGLWPKEEVDHKDTNPLNNKWDNLKEASRLINCENTRRAQRNNTSGYLGAHSYRDKWMARIDVDGKKIYLGSFDNPMSAHEAYLEAKRRLHYGCTL